MDAVGARLASEPLDGSVPKLVFLAPDRSPVRSLDALRHPVDKAEVDLRDPTAGRHRHI
jgi:hypothetical protein